MVSCDKRSFDLKIRTYSANWKVLVIKKGSKETEKVGSYFMCQPRKAHLIDLH